MPDFVTDVLAPTLKEGADLDSIKNALNDYVTKQNEEFTQGLRTNRDTILDEKKKLAEDLKAVKEQYSFLEGKEFNADTYNNLMAELETYKSSANKNDDEFRTQLTEQYEKGKKAYEETISPTLNSLKMQLEEAQKSTGDYKQKYQNYLVENKLRSTLSNMGVEADDYWFEGFRNKAKAEFGENGINDISVYHDGGYIPIGDWEKIFPTTERGKKMIKAPVNVGGAGHGSKGSGGENSSLDDIMAIKDDGQRREALAKFMAKQK